MKCLNRNKSRFYYALFERKEEIIDEYGNSTGEYEIIHSKPKEFYANISSAKGETATRQFGENENYDRVIVLENNSIEIDEYSILWIDEIPEFDENGQCITPHNYIVKKVAPSLNSVTIAISKVNVTNDNNV